MVYLKRNAILCRPDTARLKIIEVSDDTQFLDGNISRLTEETDKYVLRANANGKPEYINKTIDGITYKAIRVGNKYYIP